MSATAIATIPAASQRGGVTAASSAPSAAQLSADRHSAAASPARPPRSAQASANRAGTASSARSGRGGSASQASQPSASTARIGTARSARYVSPSGARLFGQARDQHEADHRRGRDERPAPATQPGQLAGVPSARHRHERALGQREHRDRQPEREHRLSEHTGSSARVRRRFVSYGSYTLPRWPSAGSSRSAVDGCIAGAGPWP